MPPGFLQSCHLFAAATNPSPINKVGMLGVQGLLPNYPRVGNSPAVCVKFAVSNYYRFLHVRSGATLFSPRDPLHLFSLATTMGFDLTEAAKRGAKGRGINHYALGRFHYHGSTVIFGIMVFSVSRTKNPYRVPISNTPHDPSKWSCGKRCGYCGHCDFARKSFCSGWFVMR